MVSKWIAVLACGTIAGGCLTGVAAASPSPEQQLGAFTGTQGRGADQASNPDYLARVLPDVVAYLSGSDTTSVLIDPYRKAWGKTRGTVQAISYKNRYGAKISGHLWRPKLPWRDPVTGRTTNGPLPAVIMLNGLGGAEQGYWGTVQSMAEAGYVVMSFDPQGQGASDVDPSPKAVYCDPKGKWRETQEMGLREQGPCAGTYSLPPTPGAFGPLADATAPLPVIGAQTATAAFAESEYLEQSASRAALNKVYDLTVPNFALGALDAVAWLRSSANPWRSMINVRRVGLMGHSLGAYGALLAANGDPKRRFAAAVTLDSYRAAGQGFKATVPTMLQMAENADIPGAGPKAQDDHPSQLSGRRVRADGVDEMQVALGGSTHQEWGYIPVQLADPVTGFFVNASSKGGRVGVYYAMAWFDRYLKGRRLGRNADERAQRIDAGRRLTATTFDASADGSSIGQGTYDVATNSNVPYKIGGDRVRDRLSALLNSQYRFGSHTCADMFRGC